MFFGCCMIGILDVGGGLRGAYTSGIYDYLLDKGIDINYCIGVSAGSANLITYIAGQRGRAKRFYTEYCFEKKYMSFGSYLKTGMFINLDYIYSDISSSKGKDPLDYEAIMKSHKSLVTVTTEAETAEPRYFTKNYLKSDDYTLIKASCAIPVACRNPIKFEGECHFDGGVADPIPYERAFADGCDKLIICLTMPIDVVKAPVPAKLVKLFLRKYLKIRDKSISMHTAYDERIKEIIELEKQGKVFIVYPKECFGVNTATKDKAGLNKLYELGYSDGKKIEDFLARNKEYI